MSLESVFITGLPLILSQCRERWRSMSLLLYMEYFGPDELRCDSFDEYTNSTAVLKVKIAGIGWSTLSREVQRLLGKPFILIASFQEEMQQSPVDVIKMGNVPFKIENIWRSETKTKTTVMVYFSLEEEQVITDKDFSIAIYFTLTQIVDDQLAVEVEEVRLISLRFAYFDSFLVRAERSAKADTIDVLLYSTLGEFLGEIRGIQLRKRKAGRGFAKSPVKVGVNSAFTAIKKPTEPTERPQWPEESHSNPSPEESHSNPLPDQLNNNTNVDVIKNLLFEWLPVNIFEHFTVNESFFTLGMDSLTLAEFEERLQDQFPALKIPAGIAYRNSTVNKLSLAIESIAKKTDIIEIKQSRHHFEALQPGPMQKQLLFLSKLDANSLAQFNETMSAKISDLDNWRLRYAINTVIARHGILRTAYKNDEQIVWSSTESYISTRESNDIGLRTFLDQGIDIFTSVPIALLVETKGNFHVITMKIHHIAVDGRSMQILQKELMHLYSNNNGNNGGNGKGYTKVSYIDFVQYHKTMMLTERSKKSEAYWSKYLNGFEVQLEYFDRPRGAIESHRGSAIEIPIPDTIAVKLAAIQKRLKCSPFALFTSIYFILQYRLYDTVDLCIGTPVSLRNRTFDRVIGNFLNTIVIRAKIRNDQNFDELVENVSESIANGLAHKFVPFERIVQLQRPELFTQNHSTSPLFQTFLVMDEIEENTIEIPGMELVTASSNHAKYQQTWYFIKKNLDNYSIMLEYNRDLYYQDTMKEMVKKYFFLIDQIFAKSKGAPINDLQIANEAEKLRQFDYGNRNCVDYPNFLPKSVDYPKMPLSQIFVDKVRNSNIWAKSVFNVKYKENALNSLELDKKSTQMANFIVQYIITLFGQLPTSDVPIVLFLNRTIEQIIVILALVKCGLPFIPMSIDWPRERRLAILGELNWPILIKDSNSERTYVSGDFREIDISLIHPKCNRQLHCSNSMFSLAYITYTSGSTGIPKGVCTDWIGLSNLMVAYTVDMALNNRSTVYQVVNYSFDIAYADIFKAMVNNADLVLAKSRIADSNEMRQITHAYIMPSYLGSGDMDNLLGEKFRCLQIGGEKAQQKVLHHLFQHGVKVVQEFGFSEQTVFSTRKRMRFGTVENSVGLPYPNIRTFIANGDLSLAPWSGKWRHQLCAGGIGVSRGYIGDGQLNMQKFRTAPWLTMEEQLKNNGKRIFLSGDDVTIKTNGQIRLFGRRDLQVKIRGQRVELGEIEQAMVLTGMVKECVVLLKQEQLVAYCTTVSDESDEKTIKENLVAYCTTVSDESSEKMIKEKLALKLPEFMIPQFFVFLQELPLNSNGKIDRHRLYEINDPVIDRVSHNNGTTKNTIEPMNEQEKQIADICSKILDCPITTSVASLFEFGANSLTLLLIAQKIEMDFGVEIPLRQLFIHKTIRDISKFIKKIGEPSSHFHRPIPMDFFVTEPIPLSYAQERLWFLQKLDNEDENSQYWMHFRVAIPNINPSILQTAINSIVQKQTILRTVIKDDDMGRALQEVYSATEIFFSLAQKSPYSKNPEKVFLLIIPEKRDSILSIKFEIHHLIIDGWSLKIIGEELSYYCNAILNGKHYMQRMENDYLRYSIQQRKQPRFPDFDYWLEQLKNVENLTLPIDFDRPAVFENAGKTITVVLDQLPALEKLALDHGCTLFIVLIAAYGLLLQYLSGQDTIFIGVPVANREYGMDYVVGCFVNTIVIRIDYCNSTLSDYFGSVKKTVLDALERQNVPFEQIVDQLSPPRDLSRSPIFQVMFVLQNASSDKLPEIDSKKIIVEEIKLSFAKFEQTWSAQVVNNNSAIKLEVEWCTALFRDKTIERTIEIYRQILQSMIQANPMDNLGADPMDNLADPMDSLAELRFLPTAQELQLCNKAKRITDTPNYGNCLYDIFEKQGQLTPFAIFLVSSSETLTYADANIKVTKLAYVLRQSIMQYNGLLSFTDTPIAVFCPENVRFHLIVLTILGLGFPYVPIDSRTPFERLKSIVLGSKSTILISSTRMKIAKVKTIVLDEVFEKINRIQPRSYVPIDSRTPFERLKIHSSNARDLAYIIFTSGSIGQPKGVCVEHRPVTNVLAVNNRLYPFRPNGSIYQFTRPAFDASMANSYGAMCNGSRLLLIGEDNWSITDELLPYGLPYGRIDLMHMTPTVMQSFNEEEITQLLKNVDRVSIGGEQLSHAVIETVINKGIPLINLYGPTEATITQIAAKMKKLSHSPRKLGYMLDNLIPVLLSKHGRRLPDNIAGELLIIGENLARGYMDSPELTAKKFIRNPIQNIEDRMKNVNGRGFISGDFIKLLPTGEAIYLGRLDEQYKVRGYRVEAGEIESVICSYGDIRTAAVTIEAGRISAYFISETGKPIDTSGLNEYLRDHLPDYMLPAGFMQLEKMPMTSNLKVNKRALPAITAGQLPGDMALPPDEVESAMLKLWKQALNSNSISVTDNFFDIGGHSLIASQVISLINIEMNTVLEIRDLFRHQTVRELAKYSSHSAVKLRNIEKKENIHKTNLTNGIKALPSSTVKTPPMHEACNLQIPILQLFETKKNNHPAQLAYQCILQLKMRHNQFQIHKLRIAINRLLMSNLALRTMFQKVEDKFYQHVVSGTECLINLTGTDATILINLTETDATIAPILMDPFKSAPISVVLEMGDENDFLTLQFNHALVDGRAMEILAVQLSQLYIATLNISIIKPEGINYTDFSNEYNKNLKTKKEQNEKFWREQLSQFERSQLFTDFLPVIKPSYAGRSVSMEFYGLNSLVKALTKKFHCSPLTIFLSAFHLLLRLYSHQRNKTIAIACPTTMRNPNYQDTIGYFVNTTVFVLETYERTVADLIASHQTVIERAIEHREIDFERLLQLANGNSPSFDAMIVLDNYSSGSMDNYSSGSTEEDGFQVVEQKVEVTKYPLTLFVKPMGADIRVEMEFMSDLFRLTTIEKMLKLFALIIQALNENRILPKTLFLTKNQIAQIEKSKSTDFPHTVTINHIISEQFQLTKQNLCLSSENETFNYEEIAGKVAKTSFYLEQKILQATGQLLTADDPIAIILPPSIDVTITILAIWNLGLAYIPIDSGFPMERIRRILLESGAVLYISKNNWNLDYGIRMELGLRYSDPFNDRSTMINQKNVWNRTQPSDLAYIIFTSGTTGQPKGVAIGHAGLANLAKESAINFAMRPCDTVYNFTSHCYDNSVLEMLMALCNGAKLFCPLKEIPNVKLDLENQSFTHVLLFPGMVDSLPMEQLKTFQRLRYWICGAEKATQRTIDFCLKMGVRIIQNYGPTESTAYALTKRLKYGDHAQNIGNTIGNCRHLLLDEYGNIVPVDLPGELCLTSVGLMRGYINSKRVLVDLQVSDTSYVCYKTGDTVIDRPMGTVFLGRNDLQIKIRGRRIDLGEIEAAIMQSSTDIQQTVVQYFGDRQQLIAFYTTKSGNSLSNEYMRSSISKILPRYLHPNDYVHLAAMPLTKNSKIDRMQLTYERAKSMPVDQKFRPPKTAIEMKLHRLWSEILPYFSLFGVDCDFFEIGGNSLNAGRLATKIEQCFQSNFDLYAVFQYSTIADQGKYMESQLQEGIQLKLPAHKTENQLPTKFPLSPQQEPMWFLHQSLSEQNLYNLSLIQEFDSNLNVAALHQAFMFSIAQQTVFRTYFIEDDDEPFQVVLSLTEAYFANRQNSIEENEAKFELKLFHNASFQLVHEVPIRCNLWAIGQQKFILQLCIHHIINDAWSTNLLENMISENYLKLNSGTLINPVKLDYHYVDYAIEQKSANLEEKITEGLKFWKSQLDGLILKPWDIANIFKHNNKLSAYSKCVRQAFAIPFKERIQRVCQRYKTTPYVLFLAALFRTMQKFSNFPTILIGSPIANRNSKTENLLGYFLNNVILRYDVDLTDNGKLSVDHTDNGKLIETVRNSVSQALRYSFVPFNRVVAHCRPVDYYSIHQPFYQIYFNCRYQLEATKQLGFSDISQSHLLYEVIEHAGHCIELDIDQELDGQFHGVFRVQPNIATEEHVKQLVMDYVDTLKSLLFEIEPNDPLPSSIEQQLYGIWQKCLQNSNFTAETNFFHAGGNSILTLKLRKLIFETFNIKITIDDIFRHLSFIEMLSLVEKSLESKTERKWPNVLLRIREPVKATQMTIVFFHPLLGGAYYPYANLYKFLDMDNVKILGIQHPGTFTSKMTEKKFVRESTLKSTVAESTLESTVAESTLESTVAEYLAIVQMEINGPSVFIGASLGGNLACEAGLQLQKAGIRQALPVIINIDAKPEPSKSLNVTHEEHCRQMKETLENYFNGNEDFQPNKLDEKTREAMVENAWHLLSLNRRYTPKGKFDGEFYLFRCSADGDNEEDYGWSRFCNRRPIVERISGTHQTMLDIENSREIAGKIREIIVRHAM